MEEQESQLSQNQKRTNLILIILLVVVLLMGLLWIGYRFRRSVLRLVGMAPSYSPPACTAAGQTWTSPIDGMIEVCVPSGDFLMGADDTVSDALERERPQRTVDTQAFWIDRTEVTNAQFTKFVEATNYYTWAESIHHRSYVLTDDPEIVWEDRKGANWKHPQGPQSDLSGLENHPVVHIRKNDAMAYCKWAKRRLPGEAEWEKAARGSDGRLYPWGNQPWAGNLANLADRSMENLVKWADVNVDDGYRYTAPVGSFPAGASPYGVLDMAGNVWEVVSDWSDWYVNEDESDPDKQMPIIRGSSWYGSAWEAHTFHRAMPDPNKSSVVTGFRCAVDGEN